MIAFTNRMEEKHSEQESGEKFVEKKKLSIQDSYYCDEETENGMRRESQESSRSHLADFKQGAIYDSQESAKYSTESQLHYAHSPPAARERRRHHDDSSSSSIVFN